MDKYPLYDQLAASKTKCKRNEVISTLSAMGPTHGRIVYSLMIHHWYLKSGSATSPNVYNSSMLSETRGLVFDPDSIPPDLFGIISAYVERVATRS